MKSVTVENILKKYGNTVALNGVSFDTDPGELFGIIGPDGAGKTTLFRILTTLILPDSGTANIDGCDILRDYKKIRQRVGYMPGRFSLYQDMTVEENLHLFATVFQTTVEKNYHLIKDIYSQLEPFKNRRSGKLSGGMKQKLALCCALIHKPKVLFLDEPTTGVDPVSRKEFWQMLKKLREQGITIIVSTPYMDEAKLCDRIALIKNGGFIAIETPEAIIESFPETLWAVKADHMSALLDTLRHSKGIKTSFAFGEVHHITVDTSVHSLESLKTYLENKGHKNVWISPITPTIEDCYMLLSSNS